MRRLAEGHLSLPEEGKCTLVDGAPSCARTILHKLPAPQVVPGLNAWLQLAPLPGPTLRLGLVAIMLADLIASAVAEGIASLVLYPAACRDATDRLLR
jgi:hypothetical protein